MGHGRRLSAVAREAFASVLVVALLAGCDHGSTTARKAPRGPRVVAKIRTGQDTGVVAAFGSVWAADHREGTVSRISVATNRVTARIPVGELPYDVTAGAGAVWVPALVAKRLVRIDPATNRITASIRGSFNRLAFGAGAVWVIEWPHASDPPDPWRGRYLTRIDPKAAKVVARVRLPGPSEGVAVGEGAVWVPTKGGLLVRIDPATNRIVGKIRLPAGGDTVTVGEGAVWVAIGGGRVVRVDPDSARVTAVVRTGTDVQYLDAGEGAVWAGNVNNVVDSTLSRIDPASARVTASIPVGDVPQGVAVGYGSVWVASFEEGRVWRIRP